MNITSAVVGISLMGTAMPMVVNMTIQPLMAQKRAENLAVAESAAVGYAASTGSAAHRPAALGSTPGSPFDAGFALGCSRPGRGCATVADSRQTTAMAAAVLGDSPLAVGQPPVSAGQPVELVYGPGTTGLEA